MLHARQLTKRYPIISDQINQPALQTVLAQLETVLDKGIEGDIAEFGCYVGTTSLFIRRLLDAYGQSGSRRFHAYDSFAGLPEKRRLDASAAGVDFTAGRLSVSKKQLLEQFQRARLRPPHVHKAWFSDLDDAAVPHQLAFAFLDGDFYDSILISLQLVWPRLSPGASLCIDDYQRETLPGVEAAVHDFFQGANQEEPRIHHEHNIAIICK